MKTKVNKTATTFTWEKVEALVVIVLYTPIQWVAENTLIFVGKIQSIEECTWWSSKNYFIKCWPLGTHVVNMCCDKLGSTHWAVLWPHTEGRRLACWKSLSQTFALWTKLSAFFLWNSIFTWKSNCRQIIVIQMWVFGNLKSKWHELLL